ncbi:MAG: hypothetical protein KF810_02995 [Rhizobiaceae bacterium]|nr:hypothetical protein [Rhizobiaceae bacterium]
MADKEIDDLTEAGALDGNEVFHVKQGANSRKVSLSGRLKTWLDGIYQVASAALSTIAGLSSADGNFIVGSATGWVAESGATARTSLGLGTGNTPQFTGLNIGHASDTTVTRASAGRLAVEGDMLLDVTDLIDEDDMASNSANHAPTQQSVNVFVKSRPAASDRLVTISDSASPSFNAQSGITQVARLTATANRTLAAPTNPSDGQKLIIEHTASGGARTIGFATSAGAFDLRGKTIEATPSGETDYFGFVYNAAADRWRLLAVDKQA